MRVVIAGFICGLLCVLCAKGAVCDTHGLQRRQAKPDTLGVDSLFEKSNTLAGNGKIHEANVNFYRAKKIADSLHYKAGMAKAYYTKGNILLVQRKADSAQAVLQEGIKAFSKEQYAAPLYNLLGAAYSYKGKIEKSLAAYQHAISLIDSVKNPNQLAHAKLNTADSYYDLGQKGKAFKYYQQTIAIAEQAKDSTFLAIALNNLGNTYDQEKDYKKAQYYLKRAIDISRATNFRINELRAMTNLGNTAKDQGSLDEALAHYNKAMELSKEARPNSPPTILLYNMGIVYLRKRDFKKARHNLERSLKYSRRGHIAPGVFHNSMGLSRVAEKQEHMSQAVDWAKQALNVARKSHTATFLSDANKRLYTLEKKQGNYHQALAYHESLKALSDSLDKRHYAQKLAEYKTKLDVARQSRINKLLSHRDQRQQAMLRSQRWLIAAAIIIIILLVVMALLQYRAKRNRKRALRLLREKKEEFEHLNSVKDRLFAILGHDLRSPMSAMQGILYLLRDDSLSDEELREIAGQLEISLQQNLNTMENLLNWARQQLSGIEINSTSVNLGEVAGQVLENHSFQAEQKRIRLINNISEKNQIDADPDLLQLVLRNLVNNSIKFSGQGDEITIRCCRTNNFYEIKVADTGIGIPEKRQKNIFKRNLRSRNGTNNEKGTGLGLSLCKEFVEIQGGTLSFKSIEGQGTTFIFTLPAICYN